MSPAAQAPHGIGFAAGKAPCVAPEQPGAIPPRRLDARIVAQKARDRGEARRFHFELPRDQAPFTRPIEGGDACPNPLGADHEGESCLGALAGFQMQARDQLEGSRGRALRHETLARQGEAQGRSLGVAFADQRRRTPRGRRDLERCRQQERHDGSAARDHPQRTGEAPGRRIEIEVQRVEGSEPREGGPSAAAAAGGRRRLRGRRERLPRSVVVDELQPRGGWRPRVGGSARKREQNVHRDDAAVEMRPGELRLDRQSTGGVRWSAAAQREPATSARQRKGDAVCGEARGDARRALGAGEGSSGRDRAPRGEIDRHELGANRIARLRER